MTAPATLPTKAWQEKPTASGKAAIKWKRVCGVMGLAYLISVCWLLGRDNTLFRTTLAIKSFIELFQHSGLKCNQIG